MNTKRIKQIFERMAKQVTASFESGIADRGTTGRIPMMRGGVVLPGRAAEAFLEALDEATAIAGENEAWSRSTVDDVLWDHIERVLQVLPEERPAAIRSQGIKIADCFAEALSHWIVDLLVYGIDSSCAALRFGRLMFIVEDVSVDEEYRWILEDLLTTRQMFARLEVTAIDEQSAIHRAGGILDEHLAILNFLCPVGYPSLVRVSRVNNIERTKTIHRVGRSVDAMMPMAFQAITTRVPLMSSDLKQVLSQRLVERISGMLSSPESEFSKRVLAGYALAGAACVDAHPERSFLMFAIALESVVLGKKTKSELTHQLATRVAHLIGNGASGRKTVHDGVNKLYEVRSKIVHTGEYGVSRTDSGLIRLYCATVLANLVLCSAFDGFTTIKELEGWFAERTLEGPYIVGPEPQRVAVTD